MLLTGLAIADLTGPGAGDGLTIGPEFGRDKALWKQATPKGNSSPIVVKGRVLITGWEGDMVYTLEPASEGAPPFNSMLGVDKNKDGKIQLSEYGDSLNARIMLRLMSSVDRNNGDNNGQVTEQEWNDAFGGSPDAKTPATADLEEKVVATRAISGGRLFLRTEAALYCFSKPD